MIQKQFGGTFWVLAKLCPFWVTDTSGTAYPVPENQIVKPKIVFDQVPENMVDQVPEDRVDQVVEEIKEKIEREDDSLQTIDSDPDVARDVSPHQLDVDQKIDSKIVEESEEECDEKSQKPESEQGSMLQNFFAITNDALKLQL